MGTSLRWLDVAAPYGDGKGGEGDDRCRLSDGGSGSSDVDRTLCDEELEQLLEKKLMC